MPLGEPSNDAAWRARYLRRLAGPVFIPLSEPSVYPAWRAQCLSRLADPVFIPLGGPSIDAAWRTQCLSRLAGPVTTPLGGPSVYAAWRVQYLSRLAGQCLHRLVAVFYSVATIRKPACAGFVMFIRGRSGSNPRSATVRQAPVRRRWRQSRYGHRRGGRQRRRRGFQSAVPSGCAGGVRRCFPWFC